MAQFVVSICNNLFCPAMAHQTKCSIVQTMGRWRKWIQAWLGRVAFSDSKLWTTCSHRQVNNYVILDSISNIHIIGSSYLALCRLLAGFHHCTCPSNLNCTRGLVNEIFDSFKFIVYILYNSSERFTALLLFLSTSCRHAVSRVFPHTSGALQLQ